MLSRHILRRAGVLFLRWNGSKAVPETHHHPKNVDFQPSNAADLPFSQIRHSELFGQVVRSEKYKDSGRLNTEDELKVRHLNDPDVLAFRNPDGSFICGAQSGEEARLDPLTVQGKADNSVLELPKPIADAINQHILRFVNPAHLRERAATILQLLQKDQIQSAPATSLDTDAHISALFLQDYAHVYKVLQELKKRVGDFNPQSVLDIGYGPATGMVALNELMGPDYKPETKDAYIVGRKNTHMKRRAKIILLRQWNELDTEKVEEVKEQPKSRPAPVDTSRINVKTRLCDSLSPSKRYDLIIVNQALLTREYSFPRDIDLNIEMILPLLKPNGHLVLVERGNALGFEVIARARQVMLRPESHKEETGKIPRPYLRASLRKPQKLRQEDQMITEDDLKYEAELLAQLEAEEAAEAGEEVPERKIPVKSEPANSAKSDHHVDYHLSVVAPCPHHGRCPLQLGDPTLYKVPSNKHRFSFCSFNNVVFRPKYTMELKKGKQMAVQWNKHAEDGFGLDKLTKKDLKGLEGSGRSGGNNTESGNFSYLIMHRAKNDAATIAEIAKRREFGNETEEPSVDTWPRVLDFPLKVKRNVKFNVCAPSGNVEYWQVPKSLGKQVYHDARKVQQRDLWPLGRKLSVSKNRLLEEKLQRLKLVAKSQKKFALREQRRQQWKKMIVRDPVLVDDGVSEAEHVNDVVAAQLEHSKKYKQETRKLGLDNERKNIKH